MDSPYQCPGCKRPFQSNRSAASHLRHCASYQNAAAASLQKRKMDQEDHRQAETAKRRVIVTEVDNNRVQEQPEEPEPVLTHPQYRPSGRPFRQIRVPKRYLDQLPPGPLSFATHLNLDPEFDPPIPDSPDNESALPAAHGRIYETQPNEYGIYRQYSNSFPTYDPDEFVHLSDLCNSPDLVEPRSMNESQTLLSSSSGSLPDDGSSSMFTPFPNPTTFRLMHWFHSASSLKSYGELDRLVKDVILSEDFNVQDLKKFSSEREARRLDSHQDETSTIFSANDGWITGSIEIRVPCEGISYKSESHAPVFRVEGLYHRKITEIIKSAFLEQPMKYHFAPFLQYFKPSPDRPPERIYSEIYDSDTMIAEHRAIQSQGPPNCKLERFVIAILLWSDSTTLASFGTASLWPMYLFIGNLSKYVRGKPSSFSAQHLAYIPKLGDAFQDFYRQTFEKPASAAVLRHCKRDLIQAIVELLLDEEVLEGYSQGMVLKFIDGVSRRGFLRFILHSADYPEKILFICIRFLGLCLCPRCLVLKSDVYKIGSVVDMSNRVEMKRVNDQETRSNIKKARRLVFCKGLSPDSKAVNRLLQDQSLVPTQNAFAAKLLVFGFDPFSLYVPDLLHEFESGEWRKVKVHLLRILYAQGGEGIQMLNERYRQIPSFGRGTIRKFRNNVSGMKNLAARDLEDMLQCAIPAYEHLLPGEHNNVVLDLLFELATWHALAKLRLHTDTTLEYLRTSTSRLGKCLRQFVITTCSAFHTTELPSEETARRRKTVPREVPTSATAGRKAKKFSVSTYKLHALGDYVEAIRRFGTSDNYSTQTTQGELEHRRVKRFYKMTNKINFTSGIAKRQQRERILHKMHQRMQSRNQNIDNILFAAPESHHQLSTSSKDNCSLNEFVIDRSGDPAYKNFIAHLTDHLLNRLHGNAYEGDEEEFSPAERRRVFITGNRIYFHKAMRVNYTTYDLRRDQDIINTSRLSDVMMLAHENEQTDKHPYWYCRIIHIFHVFVQVKNDDHTFTPPKRMDVLRVRWFGRNFDNHAGWKAKRLHQIGFIPESEAGAFGFVSPDVVIRAVHLMPRFCAGRTKKLLGPSIIRKPDENDEDWLYYYVGMFVDRDMFMRFRGGGVGHKSTRDATAYLSEDCDALDDPNGLDDGDFDEALHWFADTEEESDDSDTGSSPSDEESGSLDSWDDDNGIEDIWNEYDVEGYAEL